MKTLYETLLDNGDILTKKSDSILQLEKLKQYLKVVEERHGYGFDTDKLTLVNGKISWKDKLIKLNKNHADMPDDIYFGEIGSLWCDDEDCVKKHIHQFDKCKMPQLCVFTDLENFECSLSAAEFYSTVKKIKNIEFHFIPPVGFIRKCNKIVLPKLEFIKELKFDNGINVVVTGNKKPFGEDVVKYVKKGIAKRRRKDPFQSLDELEQHMMELVYEILPMDYIEKNWEGVKRIIFADDNWNWEEGERMDTLDSSRLNRNDFIIEKRNGKWIPIQRLFKL